jgi:hypothetical protein
VAVVVKQEQQVEVEEILDSQPQEHSEMEE